GGFFWTRYTLVSPSATMVGAEQPSPLTPLPLGEGDSCSLSLWERGGVRVHGGWCAPASVEPGSRRSGMIVTFVVGGVPIDRSGQTPEAAARPGSSRPTSARLVFMA